MNALGRFFGFVLGGFVVELIRNYRGTRDKSEKYVDCSNCVDTQSILCGQRSQYRAMCGL